MLENTHLPTYRRARQIADRERGGADGGIGRGSSRSPGPAQQKRRLPGRTRWAREAGRRLRAIIRTVFGLEGLAAAGFGVLWGRVSLYDQVWPFLAGVAVLAVARPGRRVSLAMAVPGVLVGLATVRPWSVVAEYGLAVAAALAGLAAWRLSPALAGPRSGWGRESVELAGLPVIVALSAALVRSLVAVIAGRPPVEFLWVGVEAAAVGFIAYVLEYVSPDPDEWEEGRRLTAEELLGLSFLGTSALLGLRGFLVWGTIDLAALAGGWAVLVAASAGGAAAGGAAGLGLTLLQLALGGGAVAFGGAAAMSIGGFAAGLLRPGGRAAVAVAYVAAYLVAAPRGEDVFLFLSQVVSAAGAGLAFLLTPARLAQAVAKVLPQERAVRQEVANISHHFRYQVSRRLHDFGRVFDELARTFAQLPAAATRSEPSAAVGVIQDVANTACGKCDKHGRCWEDDAYRSYKEFLELLKVAEVRGAVSFADVPAELSTRCLHPRKVLNAINERLALEKLETEWSRRLGESRQIVSSQLEGVADVMRGLAREAMLDVHQLEKVEAKTAAAFWRHGLRPVSVEASAGGNDRVVVDVYFSPAHKGWRWLRRRECRERECAACAGGCVEAGLLAELARLCGRRTAVSEIYCAANPDKKQAPTLMTMAPMTRAPSPADGVCFARLQPEPGLRVDWYGASHAKDNVVVCGDSFSQTELPDGRTVVLVSDGMGTGVRASLESGATVSMLEELMRAGLDREFAVKTVNSVLLLRSPEEVFATVDLLVVDRYSGLTEFVKIGAAPSFIKRGREVGVVSSSTLPIGILSNVDAEVVTRMLRPGDIVVMATDGLTAGSPGEQKPKAATKGGGGTEGEAQAPPAAPESDEGWVAAALAGLVSDDPKEIAEALLAEAQARGGDGPGGDDITVVAVRIGRVDVPDEAARTTSGWAAGVRAASLL